MASRQKLDSQLQENKGVQKVRCFTTLGRVAEAKENGEDWRRRRENEEKPKC